MFYLHPVSDILRPPQGSAHFTMAPVSPRPLHCFRL